MVSQFGGIEILEKEEVVNDKPLLSETVKTSKFGGVAIEEPDPDQQLPGGGTVGDQTFLRKAEPATLWEKAKHLMRDPDKEGAKAVQALVDAEAFGIRPNEALRYRDVIDRGIKINPQAASRESDLTDRVNQSWEIGKKQNYVGEIGYKYITTGDPRFLEQIRNVKFPDETETFISESILEDSVRSAAKLLPMIIETGTESVGKGMEVGMGFGLITALLGQAGPQAALPEEILTVPAATLVGFKIGATSGAFEASLRKEAGLALSEIINFKDEEGNEIDPNIARATAFGIGSINAGIEVAQLRLLINTIPGMSKLFSEATMKVVAGKAVKDKLLALAGKFAGTVATETAQEVAQESTNIVFEELAKEINNKLLDTDIKPTDVETVLNRLEETMIESAQGFAVLALPGTVTKAGLTRADKADVKQSEVQEDLPIATQEEFDKLQEDVPDAIVIGTQEDSEGNITGFTMADVNTGNTFEVSEAPTAEEINQGLETVREAGITQIDTDIDSLLEIDETEIDAEIDRILAEPEITPEVTEEIGPKTQAFQDQVSQVVPEEEANAVNTLLDARAKAVGMTTDEYIELHGLEIVEGEQADFGEGDLAQAGSEIVLSIESEFADADLKYDGEFDRTALNKDPLFQFTPQSGPFKGRTISVEELSVSAVKESLDALKQEQTGPTEQIKATVTFEDTKTIIRAFETADVSSLVHELGHVFRRDIGGDELVTVENWAGVEDGNWTVDAEEKFARGFENYLATGQAPTAELTSIFEKFKKWMSEIYNSIKGSSIDVEVTPEIKEVFDRLLTPAEDTGTLQQAAEKVDQIDTESFKNWFGDSKVVDEKGNPLVVFHGTNKDFTEFDPTKGISLGKGNIFFTKDKSLAEDYGHRLIPVYIKAEKLKKVNSSDEFLKLIKDPETKKLFDGVEYTDVSELGNDIHMLIVFNPTQIKSATENIGTFDPQDPSILKQKEEPVKTRVRRTTGQKRNVISGEIIDKDLAAITRQIQVQEGGDAALKAMIKESVLAARKAKSEGNKTGVAKEKARMKEIVARGFARRKVSASVKQIKARIKKELKFSKVKKQSGKPVGKFTPEIQDILNTLISTSKLKPVEAEKRIAENLERFQTEPPPQDVVIENHLLEMVARVDTMKDPEQLQSLLDEIKALKDEGRLINELKKFNRESKNIERVAATVEELGGVPEGVKITGVQDFVPTSTGAKIKRALKTMGKTIVGWDDLMDILSFKSETAPGESFISKDNDLLGTKNIEKRGTRIAMESINDIYMDTFDLKSGRQVIKKVQDDNSTEMTLNKVPMTNPVDGSYFEMDLKFTRAELRKRAMELSDPSLTASFVEMGYNEDTKAFIFNSLTDQDKVFMQAQLDFYRDFYDGTNDVYKVIYGINLPKNEFYTPIAREGISKAVDDGMGEFMKEMSFRATAASAGALKSRVGSVLTISKQSDITVMERHITEMEHFKAWAEKIRDLNAVWKNPGVRAAVEINHGKDVLGLVDNFISDIANGASRMGQKLKGLDLLRINFTKSVLAVNPDVTIKQLTSFVAYAEKMPVNQFVKYQLKFWAHPVKNMKTIYTSELMKARSQNIERDIKAAMQSSEKTAFGKNQSLINMLLLNIKLGDQGAITVGGWAYYQWLKDAKGLSHEQAITKFEKFTENTQQSADITEQSYWQRGGSLAKLVTMFTSSPNQYLRKEIGALRNFAAGRQGIGQTAKTLIIFHMLLPMFFQFVSDRFTWDEDEQKRAFIFGALNGWFIVGDGLDFVLRKMLGMRTFNMELPVYSVFHDFIKASAIVDLFDLSADEFFRAVRGIAGISGAATGIPFKQFLDESKGVVDILDGEYEQGLTELMGYSPYLAEKLSKD